MRGKYMNSEIAKEDFALIVKQCTLQHAILPRQVAGFTAVYVEAKNIAETDHLEVANNRFANYMKEQILIWADMIEPCNVLGYRKVPVVFANGNRGLAPEHIERQMKLWCEHVFDMEPEDAYTAFEKIHPFQDGNGRLGHVLWAVLVTFQTGIWPMYLPPDVFAQAS